MDESLMELFAKAFREGCDVSLQNIQKSRRFLAALRRFAGAPREHRRSGEGSIVGLGLWEFATALNSLGETNARAMMPASQHQSADPKVMALTESLGEQLIRTGKPRLPASVTDAARKWSSSSADEQLKLAFVISKALRGAALAPTPEAEDEPTIVITGDEVDQWLEDTSWNDEGCDFYELTGTKDIPVLSIWERTDLSRPPSIHRRYRPEESLPRAFNITESDGTRPNCLGLAMLLCAFAEMTGSPYLLSSHLEHRASQPNLWTALLGASGAARLHDLDIPLGPQQEEKIKEETERDLEKWSLDEFDDFHYSLVIQLADKRWLLMDPYQKTVVALGDDYEVDQANATLRRYADLYPGLTVLADDGGFMAKAIERLEALNAEPYEQTESIMAPMHEVPFSPDMMRQLLDAKEAGGQQKPVKYWVHDYTSYLQQLESAEAALRFEIGLRQFDDWGETPLTFTALPYIVERIFSRCGTAEKALGEELFEKVSTEYLDALWESNIIDWDPDDYPAMTREVLETYVVIMERQVKKLQETIWSGLEYAHPVIELMNPRFGLALALLNQLRCWTDTDLNGSVLLDYGS